MHPSDPSEQPSRDFRLYAVIMLIAYMALIAYFSLQPGSVMPKSINDKVLHFSAYAGMTALAAWSFKTWRQYVLGVIGIILFSATLELLQSLVPGRFMSGWDLLANSCGALLMTFVAVFLSRFRYFAQHLPARLSDNKFTDKR